MSTGQDPSTAAEQARARLHEEIERVRAGVEEMLTERGSDSPAEADLRRELEELRAETRRYVNKRVRKSEKRLRRRVEEIDERTAGLERRLDRADEDRKYAEWRIHANTEAMLDGLLREIRSIADLLTRGR